MLFTRDRLKEKTTMDTPEPVIHSKLGDRFSPRMNILEVGIKPGFYIRDYGCEPMGYLTATSGLVGRSGKICDIDIYPAGNEPMLSLKCNLTYTVYRMPHPEDRTPLACHEYESCIYANYTAPPDAEISIHIEFTGENAWVWVGGSGNEYMGPRVSATLAERRTGCGKLAVEMKEEEYENSDHNQINSYLCDRVSHVFCWLRG